MKLLTVNKQDSCRAHHNPNDSLEIMQAHHLDLLATLADCWVREIRKGSFLKGFACHAHWEPFEMEPKADGEMGKLLTLIL